MEAETAQQIIGKDSQGLYQGGNCYGVGIKLRTAIRNGDVEQAIEQAFIELIPNGVARTIEILKEIENASDNRKTGNQESR